ncbi:protein-disulfide reductase DsbD family protein [Verrucomicrobiota bacterium]
MMKRAVIISAALMVSLLGIFASAQEEPFSVSSALGKHEGKTVLSVSFSVAKDHYLYADKISVVPSVGIKLKPKSIPKPKEKYDQVFEATVTVYDHDVKFEYHVEAKPGKPIQVEVNYQGCSGTLCYPPITRTFTLTSETESVQVATLEKKSPEVSSGNKPKVDEWEILAKDFKVIGRQAGYLNPKAFITFLDESKENEELGDDWLQSMFNKSGIWIVLAIALILLGGLSLNLTPCVLPMIPINIAIIGAGATAGTKRRGFALGGAYGAAMAVVYGVLGLFVVLTGAKFGVLNSSIIFNTVIAIVFIVLALAMFDVYSIDLSRFQGKIKTGSAHKGHFVTAFFMGGIAALLAGACVAPVVMSVLLLSTNLYANGKIIGLILPFLLGAGMGIPWPFLGAGLSFMPKPGKWMEHVKHIFGVIIIGFALYYGYQAVKLFMWNKPGNKRAVETVQSDSQKDNWHTSLPGALEIARQENKMVLIDFWASWCKNCLAMEKTFKDAGVKERLKECVNVKYRAEKMSDPETKRVLDYFHVPGLPTYVILKPELRIQESEFQRNNE